MNSLDVDETIGYVNKIIDNVRCSTCDKLDGSRLRHPCGHTTCDDCADYIEECQTCISPSPKSHSQSRPDRQLSQAVNNATNLLKACKNLFVPNAFQHKRLSEQLRIEREIFPKCIQAPIKYENKKKRSYSSANKENKSFTFFPGEATSTSKENIMENSVSYVQQWLNKNDKNLARKPFADLNINSQSISVTDKNNKDGFSLGANNKRSHFKTTDKDLFHSGQKKRSVYKSGNASKKIKKEEEPCAYSIGNNSDNLQTKCDNDESGIFMDNDPIVINDSQESVIDKDKRAWLAVLEACKNEDLESSLLQNSSQMNCTNESDKVLTKNAFNKKTNDVAKVPFLKKGAIVETCELCKDDMNAIQPPHTKPTKPVRIIIDNDNFLTTITVFQTVPKNGISTKKSASVQTETCVTTSKDNDICMKNCIHNFNDGDYRYKEKESDNLVNASDTQSEDLFADDRKIFGNVCPKEKMSKCIVIEESDSDSELEASGPLSVKADVHRSCEKSEYGTLAEILNKEEHERKPRRGPRGLTPTSTDSSEKENYDPNRLKRRITGKKKLIKK